MDSAALQHYTAGAAGGGASAHFTVGAAAGAASFNTGPLFKPLMAAALLCLPGELFFGSQASNGGGGALKEELLPPPAERGLLTLLLDCGLRARGDVSGMALRDLLRYG